MTRRKKSKSKSLTPKTPKLKEQRRSLRDKRSSVMLTYPSENMSSDDETTKDVVIGKVSNGNSRNNVSLYDELSDADSSMRVHFSNEGPVVIDVIEELLFKVSDTANTTPIGPLDSFPTSVVHVDEQYVKDIKFEIPTSDKSSHIEEEEVHELTRKMNSLILDLVTELYDPENVEDTSVPYVENLRGTSGCPGVGANFQETISGYMERVKLDMSNKKLSSEITSLKMEKEKEKVLYEDGKKRLERLVDKLQKSVESKKRIVEDKENEVKDKEELIIELNKKHQEEMEELRKELKLRSQELSEKEKEAGDKKVEEEKYKKETEIQGEELREVIEERNILIVKLEQELICKNHQLEVMEDNTGQLIDDNVKLKNEKRLYRSQCEATERNITSEEFDKLHNDHISFKKYVSEHLSSVKHQLEQQQQQYTHNKNEEMNTSEGDTVTKIDKLLTKHLSSVKHQLERQQQQCTHNKNEKTNTCEGDTVTMIDKLLTKNTAYTHPTMQQQTRNNNNNNNNNSNINTSISSNGNTNNTSNVEGDHEDEEDQTTTVTEPSHSKPASKEKSGASAKQRKKTLIFTTSISKGIKAGKFNRCHDGDDQIQFTRFPGARAKHMTAYVTPRVTDEKPETVIIQGGGNDLPVYSEITPLLTIANHIIDAGLMCRERGVQNVLIGGVTTRKENVLKNRCEELNGIIKDLCKEHKFMFIDNSDISDEHLYDGVHLNEEGTTILADGYLNALKKICH